MFLLAWIFLGAAIGSLYLGLSEEGRAFLYLSMAASGLTVVLALVQLRRGSPARVASRQQRRGTASGDQAGPGSGEDRPAAPSSPER